MNPVIGYYKICHIAKEERQPPEFFFYRSGEQALACATALAVAKGRRSVDTHWVVSNYDPSNRCHPALAEVVY